jgi:hypothetical protein
VQAAFHSHARLFIRSIVRSGGFPAIDGASAHLRQLDAWIPFKDVIGVGTRRASGFMVAKERRRNAVKDFNFYQHDGPTTFRFVLHGRLDHVAAVELEHAWLSATSVLRGKELVLDLTSLDDADEAGLALMSRMQEAGARVIPPANSDQPVLTGTLGLSTARPVGGAPESHWRRFAARFLPEFL